MQENKHNSQLLRIQKLSQALIAGIGQNAPYPTPEEIDAHKRRAEQSLKYQNLTFTNDANQ